MDAIVDIYRRSIQPSEKSMRNDKMYVKVKNQANQYYQTLYERLPQNERDLLERFVRCYDIKFERKNIHCFKAGFKIGLTVAVQSLEK